MEDDFITETGLPNLETLERYATRLRDADVTKHSEAEKLLADLPQYAREMVLTYYFPRSVVDALVDIASKHLFEGKHAATDVIQHAVDYHRTADLDAVAFKSWAMSHLPWPLPHLALRMHSQRQLTPAGRARAIRHAMERVLPLLEDNPDLDRAYVRGILANSVGWGTRDLLRALFPHGDDRVPYTRKHLETDDSTSLSETST